VSRLPLPADLPFAAGRCGTILPSEPISSRLRPSSTPAPAERASLRSGRRSTSSTRPLWLVGTDGIAVPQLVRELSPAAAERTRLFVANRAPFAFYGFEAMALALDSIAEGDGDREAVTRAARATRDRRSPLGTYSLDENGLTTMAEYGRLAVIGHELAWDVN
jgi:hypothetical protein